MTTAKTPAAALADRTADPRPDRSGARRLWRTVSLFLVSGYFIQAGLAGAMMSGIAWARHAHAAMAGLLIAFSLLAAFIALSTLRRVGHGPRLGLTLLLLAVTTVAQAVVGALSAKGANLTWVHVPLGVALVGLAGYAANGARRLGGD